ncbi:hypothetical protein O181_025907 [Austropuccinia psidii MF-1]|uniref:Uncharacterized protein n=1 Tax=Austropuccinia psidii MF-1 TaxID=1389203 RepID=A0A9Q3H0B5_9BASI|nr:hypothetical protein [Austropuccinia psidii MF-1]
MNWLLHHLPIISASYPCLRLCKNWLLKHCLHISAITHPYASAPPTNHLCNSPCLHSGTTLSCSKFTILTLRKLLASTPIPDHFPNLTSLHSCTHMLPQNHL